MHSSIACLNPCALRAHGFKQAMHQCFQSKLQHHTGSADCDEPALTPYPFCAQVSTITEDERSNELLVLRRIDDKNRYAHADCARTAFMFTYHVLPRVHWHLPGIGSRVNLHVISFLAGRIICFLLLSFHASVVVVMLLSSWIAQKPERFFFKCHLHCSVLSFYITYALQHSGTFRFLACVRKLDKSLNFEIESEVRVPRLGLVFPA